MKKMDIVHKILQELKNLYPDAVCSLEYHDHPYRLLIAVRLAAQCTDARVNIICKDLFQQYPTLEDIASIDINKLSSIIRSCGFYHVKAQNIKDMTNLLLSKFNGKVPSSMEELLSLPGVGRKSANLIRGDIFGFPAIVADTHCIRISNRLGLSSSKKPDKVEMDLLPIIPPENSNDFCHRLVLFGRDICTARSPKCGSCPLSTICPSVKL